MAGGSISVLTGAGIGKSGKLLRRAARPFRLQEKGGSEAFESYNNHFVYYTKFGSPGIWEVPVGGGDECGLSSKERP